MRIVKWLKKSVAGKILRATLAGLLLVTSIAIALPSTPALATTGTFYSTASDGWIFSTNAVWNTAWTAASGTSANTSQDAYVGNLLVAPNYYVERGYLYFDTSSLGGSVTVTSATLSLYGKTDSSTYDFNVTVTSGQPTYPHDPLVAGDYDKTNYAADNGGDLSTASWSIAGYNDIVLNATGRGFINKTGTTKLCIRDSTDISGSTASGMQEIGFYLNEKGEGYKPKLTITYTTGTVPTVTTSAVTNINAGSARGNGEVTASSENLTIRGFVWSTTTHGDPGDVAPSSSNYSANWTESGSWAIGTFNSGDNITGLSVGTTYYMRATAKNSAHWAYGSEVSFKAGTATLTVQPSIIDTHLYQQLPTNNYGTATSLLVQSFSTGGINYNYRTILRFYLSGVPTGSTISTANLSLYYYGNESCDPVGRTYYADALTRHDWTEAGATWNNYKEATTWTTAGGDYTSTNETSVAMPAGFGWVTWNILGITQTAYNGSTYLDVIIRDGTEGNASQRLAEFYSREYAGDTSKIPKLYLEYTTVAAPSVSVSAATNVEETTAQGNGEVTFVNDTNIIARGFQWGTAPSSYTSNWTETGTWTTGTFNSGTANITSLSPGTLYYMRAIAENSDSHWGYSSEITFLTKPTEPTTFVATAGDNQTSLSWAKGGGADTTIVRGNIGSYPADYSANVSVYSGSGSSTIHTGLTNGNVWDYRMWSLASKGGLTQYSDTYASATATPHGSLALVISLEPVAGTINTTSANATGYVIDLRSEGNVTRRGFEWGTAPDTYPNDVHEDGSFGIGKFTLAISSLPTGSMIYYRAYAVNTNGVAYGQPLLYYNYILAPYHYIIGLANTDQTDFSGYTLSPLNPIITPTVNGELDVKDPQPIVIGDKIYLYYDSFGSPDVSKRGVFLAISTDGGQSFTRYSSSPVWPNGGYISVYDTEVVGSAKRYAMLYATYDGYHWSTNYAYSAEGIVWHDGSHNPVIGVGAAGQWDDYDVAGGGVVTKIGNTYYVYYGGRGDSSMNWDQGLVTFTDFEGTWTKSPSNPLHIPRHSAIQTLTSQTNVGTTTVHVANTAVFEEGELVWLEGVGGTPQYNRILTKTDSTHLELQSAAVANAPEGATIRSWAYNAVGLGSPIYNYNTMTWICIGTAWLPYDDARIPGEVPAYLTSTDGITWTYDFWKSPPLPFDYAGGTASTENMRIINGGGMVQFMTLPGNNPVVQTNTAVNVDTTSATLQGTITTLGDYSPVYAYFQYGLTTAYGTTTVEQTKTATGGFNQIVSGLAPSTLYHFQAVVRYSGAGYVYGVDFTLMTAASTIPTATTGVAASLTTTAATLQGSVTSLGSYSTVFANFEYGLTTAYGTSTSEQTLSSPASYNAGITGLTPNTTYHFRSKVRYATSSYIYGSDASFTTNAIGLPSVTTGSATSITTTGGILQGTLSALGDYTTVYVSFEYGLTAGYGSTTVEQTLTTTAAFSATLTGLTSNTQYHFRARVRYAAASYVNGSDNTFTTLAVGGAPGAPTNFRVSSYTANSTTLSWNKGTGATNTMIRWATTGYPTAPTEGTQLYSAGGTTATQNDQTTGTRYYYSAWSETGGLYSATYVSVSNVPTADILPAPDILEIETLQVYQNYINTGDQLIVYSAKIIWSDGMPTTYNPSDFFYIQVYDGATLVKQDRIKLWGYVPGSLYVSSIAPLTWNYGYTFKIVGTSKFSTPPESTYTMTASNYIGGNYDYLSQWVIDLASRMEQSSYWNITFLDYTSQAASTILTSQGAQVFNTAIPGLSSKCGNIFYPVVGEPPYVPSTEELDYFQSMQDQAETNSGPVLWDLYTGVGDLFDLAPQTGGMGLWIVMYVIVMLAIVAIGVPFIPALLIAVPIVFGATQFGLIGMEVIIGVAILLCIFWLWNTIFKTGAQ